MTTAIESFIVKQRASNCFFYCQTIQLLRDEQLIEKALEETGLYKIAKWDYEKNEGNPDVVFEMLETLESGTVVIAKNFHWFLTDEYKAIDKDRVSFLINRSELYSERSERKSLVILGDVPFEEAIPSPLQRLFVQIRMDMPSMEEIKEVYGYVEESVKDKPNFREATTEEKEMTYQVSRGMTRKEIQSAYTESLIKDKGQIKPKTISSIRASDCPKGIKILKQNDVFFDSVKGYNRIKRSFEMTVGSKLSLGMLIVGPAGTGKTHFSHAAGNESGLAVFVLEPAQLVGEGLYGQAENDWRRALDFISANAPCILLIDEIEKGLGGGASSAISTTGDSTSERSSSQLLKFLSDERPEGVYVIATCNNIKAMPAAWVRAERWDNAPWLIDLPNKVERAAILDYYKMVYEVDGEPKSTEGWAGAELKSACRILSMWQEKKPETGMSDIEHLIIPASVTMADEIGYLRKWAVGKTVSASDEEVF